jgi:hypothetical protein
MGVALLHDISSVFTPPPSVDWASLPAGDGLKRVEKRIEKFETDATEWRALLVPKLNPLLEGIKAKVVDKLDESSSNALAGLSSSIEQTLEILKTPMHHDPIVAAKIEELSKAAPSAGKFLRKLMRRAERTRVSLYEACVDMYYGILAFRSEFENCEEANQTFNDPAALGAFLRRNVA